MDDRTLRPLKFYKELHEIAGRRASGCFLVEGVRFVQQLIDADAGRIDEILVRDDAVSFLDTIPRTIRRRLLPFAQYASISPNRSPQPISAVVHFPAGSYAAELPAETGLRILLLEDVQDPGNVGTLLRSAAGFGFDGAILSDKCADPFSPRAVAASAGAVLSLWIRRSDTFMSLVAACRSRGLRLLAADLAGVDVAGVDVGSGCILAMGNEGNGLSMQLRRSADVLISVPFFADRVESLNVGAAGAVCMYALMAR